MALDVFRHYTFVLKFNIATICNPNSRFQKWIDPIENTRVFWGVFPVWGNGCCFSSWDANPWPSLPMKFAVWTGWGRPIGSNYIGFWTVFPPKKWGKFKASTPTMDLKLAILPTLQLRGAGMAISLQSFDLICQETWEGGMLNGSFLRMIFGTVAMASWWVSVMYGYVLWLGQCKVWIRTLGRWASNMFWSFWWHCGYLTLWAAREDEEHWCKMIMKIHFRNGTGLAPPLCECCINNFCRVQLSAPCFSVWSSAKNGWIYHGEGCFLGVSNRDRHRNFSQDCRIAWYTLWVFGKIRGTTGTTFFWLQHEYGNIKLVRFMAIWF